MGGKKRSKRGRSTTNSMSSLPKGLPIRPNKRLRGGDNHAQTSSTSTSSTTNPFEQFRATKSKFPVHNRKSSSSSNNNNNNNNNSSSNQKTSKLAKAIEKRRDAIRESRIRSKKAGGFLDRRIGEATNHNNQELAYLEEEAKRRKERAMMARVIRERARRSSRLSKFDLANDNDDVNGGGAGGGDVDRMMMITHKGKPIDESYEFRNRPEDVILSDDDEDYEKRQLDRADTEMHFGGRSLVNNNNRRGGRSSDMDVYGPGGTNSTNEQGQRSLKDIYGNRKGEFDDFIMRKKWEKAEKARSKEEQVETFEGMDDQFREIANLLNFRDKEKERKEQIDARNAGTLPKAEAEMEDWDKEVKSYLFERKVKATDRTKTPEEKAKEEAERLQELESKRLARMNGDFDDDDLSDIESEEEDTKKNKYVRKKEKNQRELAKQKKMNKKIRSQEDLSSSSEDDDDDDENDGTRNMRKKDVRFTADGLVYVDKHGKVLGKVADDQHSSGHDGSDVDNQDESDEEEEETGSDESDKDSEDSYSSSSEDKKDNLGLSDDEASRDGSDSDSDEPHDTSIIHAVGARIKGRYKADEQYMGMASWYNGKVVRVTKDKAGNVLYDVEYDDGDCEEGMRPENVKPLKSNKNISREEDEDEDEDDEDAKKKAEIEKLKKKRSKAKHKARTDIPYTFEVPTTLEALHDLIGAHAATGKDACLIIQRIHTSNSVRLNKNNAEKMQNFYDVLLRRFIGVGNALYNSGDGGDELCRYEQLSSLTRTMYAMAQDSPSCAGAIWGRRLGFMLKAHAKRLRDAELIRPENTAVNIMDTDALFGQNSDNEMQSHEEEEEFSAWPSMGDLFLLRSLGHIFPVTDKRHLVTTPALILLGQILAQTPILSIDDVVKGLFCAGLMIEYTSGSGRIAPEAIAFIAGVINLFAMDGRDAKEYGPLPSLNTAADMKGFMNMRQFMIDVRKDKGKGEYTSLSFERNKIKDSKFTPENILLSALMLVEKASSKYTERFTDSAGVEVFDQVSRSLLRLGNDIPKTILKALAKAVRAISLAGKDGAPRAPLFRRAGAKIADLAIKTYDPRMEDPERYSMSRGTKSKSSEKAMQDRMRREYKRERKAVSRELRLDAAFTEKERRRENDAKNAIERQKRQKNFAWLEQEQATMNQQVAQGGGLLKGGGIGAARFKAKSGKIGMKRGNKF